MVIEEPERKIDRAALIAKPSPRARAIIASLKDDRMHMVPCKYELELNKFVRNL